MITVETSFLIVYSELHLDSAQNWQSALRRRDPAVSRTHWYSHSPRIWIWNVKCISSIYSVSTLYLLSIYWISTEYLLCSHDLLVEDPDAAVAHVGVGGADAGAAQVEQVPGVGVLVPPPSVLAHQERGDTCSQGLLAFKCIFGDILLLSWCIYLADQDKPRGWHVRSLSGVTVTTGERLLRNSSWCVSRILIGGGDSRGPLNEFVTRFSDYVNT